MRLKKIILFLSIFLLGLGLLLLGLYYLKTESSKLTFYTETGEYAYYLPDYSINYFSSEKGQTYIRVSDIFVKTWSLRKFFVDHWWSGSTDIWLKIEDGKINEAIASLDYGVDHREEPVIFASSQVSGEVSSESLKGVTFFAENDEEKLSVHFSNLELGKGTIDPDLEEQYKLLSSSYFEQP